MGLLNFEHREEFQAHSTGAIKTTFYNMNRRGFTVLAMGFTGEKALKWKLRYIDAFEAMEAELRRLLAERQTAIVPVSAPALDLPAMLQDMTGLQNLVVGLLGRGAELEREVAEKAALLAVQGETITTQVLAIEDMRPRAAAGARFVELNGAVCPTMVLTPSVPFECPG